jgi:hypothetical protein
VTLVWDDIRALSGSPLRTYLAKAFKRLPLVFGERSNYTVCLLGTQALTPDVCAMDDGGWTWGTPYTISLDSESHTLANDVAEQCKVHSICEEALNSGDNTFGAQQAVVFRWFKGERQTDSTIRGKLVGPRGQREGPGLGYWHAGRTQFVDHRDNDVPSLPKATQEPYHFSLNLSSVMPYAEEYPMEFAFANFIYWHSREGDVILIHEDAEDVFGTAALFCGRRVIKASRADNAPIAKAYTTMSYLLTAEGHTSFNAYSGQAKFATMAQVTRNTRTSAADACSILHSQTVDEVLRYKKKNYEFADYTTPCTMV